MTKPHKKDPIPGQVSREELARFWDTHSIADYRDELSPVQVTFAKNLSQKLAIRLDTQTLTAVQQEAYRKGIGPSTFVRMIVKDYFHTGRNKVSAA